MMRVCDRCNGANRAKVAQAVLTVQNPLIMISLSLTLFRVPGRALSTVHTISAMFPLSIACLSGFVSAATSLNIAPQDSIVITSDTTTPSSNPLEMVSPTNQSASWPNNPLPPARAPSLPANISALRALGLDTERPLSWVTAPSGVTLGVQCNVRYGRRLDYQDCLDALGYLPRADERISRFAQRHSGLPHEIALPQRILGSMSSFSPSAVFSLSMPCIASSRVKY